MKQELLIDRYENGIVKYHPAISGQIELKKLSNTLSILKLYFQKLRILEKPKDMYIEYYDDSTEVSLSNYPINISSLNELDNKNIYIEKGFGGKTLTTMLSIYDGEPINNSNIYFKKIKENCFEITWTGSWGEEKTNRDDFKLKMIAYKEDNIITPLCERESDLIKKFDRK